ncbi:sugar ABC transporter permease [Cryobacterium melibiosiphilum]|uniref:Sugar ABC transporter permease n=1 Tax=Cryobacterium melibiosiphilum TaxID=995039 RepID=A0A3A5MPC0_9MICO|nr:sugar ABC transporter permease [Cryobacterium melibiosiphilum]RJT89669.1 sugar ABC transporter permease [Cryobacterium melibiosiphilum]
MSRSVIDSTPAATDSSVSAPETRIPLPPRRRRRRSPLAYWLILPAVLLELLVHLIPMVLGVWIAFISLNQLTLTNWVNAPFVGLQNFMNGLDPNSSIGQAFFATIGRTLLYTVLVVGFSWTLGMAAAVFLNSKFRGRALLRTFFLVPYALPAYVGTIAWAFMFNNRDGAINQVLVDTMGLFDGDRPFWLLGDNAFGAMVIVNVWQLWPFAFLMLMAALQNVPNDVYEAAALDGASLWQQFRTITLPMVQPANGVLLLVMSLWTFNQFNVPFVLFGATSPESATLISPLIYQNSFGSWNFGLGGAMSVLLLLVLLVASAFYIRMVLPKGKNND